MTYLTERDAERYGEPAEEAGYLPGRTVFSEYAVERIAARVAAETRESVLDEVEQGIVTLTHSALPGSGYARGLTAGQNVVRDLRGGDSDER